MEDRNEAAKPPTGMEPGSAFASRRRLERLVERVRDEGLVPRVVLGTAALGGAAWEDEVRRALAALVGGAAMAGFDRVLVRKVQKQGFRPEGLQVVLELPLPLGGVCDDVLECVERAEDGQRIDLAELRAWAHGIGRIDEPHLAAAVARGGLTVHEVNVREGLGAGAAADLAKAPLFDLHEVLDLLGQVLEEKPEGPKLPTEKELAGMTAEDLDAAADWAMKVHLRAGDHDEVEVPPIPRAIRNVLEVLGWKLEPVFLEGKPALDPDAEASRLEREEAQRLDSLEEEREAKEAADEEPRFVGVDLATGPDVTVETTLPRADEPPAEGPPQE